MEPVGIYIVGIIFTFGAFSKNLRKSDNWTTVIAGTVLSLFWPAAIFLWAWERRGEFLR